ncbi:hypothetical protein [Kitasatospora sp. NPDC057015]|uniref:hypothetical protein n=1 Tax=Kitasatospora sp. NPDC057015 TaxID=3346001 RepID=UPI0036344B00
MLAWDGAGACLAVEESGRWLRTVPDESRQLCSPSAGGTAAPGRQAEFGDLIQRLAFTAAGLDTNGIIERLDACLLTDAEPAAGKERWASAPDAFEDLLEPVVRPD